MKVLVAFNDKDEDMCQGDSGFGPESCGEYVDGMTFTEAREMFFTRVQKNWYPDDEPVSTDKFIEDEFSEDVTGFWIIDEKIHDIIENVSIDFGNDSACYAGLRTMKTQIDRGSERYLRP
jgi:hypothetical protein